MHTSKCMFSACLQAACVTSTPPFWGDKADSPSAHASRGRFGCTCWRGSTCLLCPIHTHTHTPLFKLTPFLFQKSLCNSQVTVWRVWWFYSSSTWLGLGKCLLTWLCFWFTYTTYISVSTSGVIQAICQGWTTQVSEFPTYWSLNTYYRTKAHLLNMEDVNCFNFDFAFLSPAQSGAKPRHQSLIYG